MPGYSEDDLPSSCSLESVESVFLSFLKGINKRDRQDVVQRVSRRPELNWFGVESRRGTTLRLQSPRAVFRYFVRRNARHRLLAVQVSTIPGVMEQESGPFSRPKSGPRADDSVIDANFKLSVRGRWFGSGPYKKRLRVGKVGINCDTDQFYVWNGG